MQQSKLFFSILTILQLKECCILKGLLDFSRIGIEGIWIEKKCCPGYAQGNLNGGKVRYHLIYS